MSTEVRGAGVYPGSWVGGRWTGSADDTPLWAQHNPADWSEVVGRVPLCSGPEVHSAATHARAAQRRWRLVPRPSRAGLLRAWADALRRRGDELAMVVATEVGKPVAYARAEVSRAVELLHLAAAMFGEEEPWEPCGGSDVAARRCPVGVVGLITPWNNPVSIPVGKIGPAIVLGNGVVWKPALEAPATSMVLTETLVEAAAPEGLVDVVFGDGGTGRAVIADALVDAVSVTGSRRTGTAAAAACAQVLKPIQAELGGNNAALVLADCEVSVAAHELAVSAYGFAGQRCTATRRLIVERGVLGDFLQSFEEAAGALRLGDPRESSTSVGPLVSMGGREKVQRVVDGARARGGAVLFGGGVPPGLGSGCWFEPTLLRPPDDAHEAVVEETFAPLATLQAADDLDEALQLCNGVAEGLVASLYSHDPEQQGRFLDQAEAGVLKLNQPTAEVDPAAPFGGWKASGLGPPEHGRWDGAFYTRPQALYGVRLTAGAPLGPPPRR